jgi:uncharacterized membrane protein YbhN (UPF0104 family)
LKAIAWKTVAKWLWVLAVIIFVIYYAGPRHEEILQAVEVLGWLPVFFAFFFIVIAKLGLVVNMRLACARFGIYLGWWDCFRIYNHTQLAKYIPGSIWQFVGRIAIFNSRGYEGRTIRDALVAEHFWVILVAGALGIVPLLLGNDAYINSINNSGTFAEQWPKFGVWGGVFFVTAIILSVVTIWRWISKLQVLIRWFIGLMPSWRVVTILLLTWALFGASLWVTIQPFVEYLPPYAQIVGVYCLAYVIGFLIPFAPAGLGVRELVLVLGLSVWVNPDIALLLAGVNRLVYLVAEICLAAIGLIRSGLK